MQLDLGFERLEIFFKFRAFLFFQVGEQFFDQCMLRSCIAREIFEQLVVLQYGIESRLLDMGVNFELAFYSFEKSFHIHVNICAGKQSRDRVMVALQEL